MNIIHTIGLLVLLITSTIFAFSKSPNPKMTPNLEVVSTSMAVEIMNGNYDEAITLGAPTIANAYKIKPSEIHAMMGILNGISFAYIKTGRLSKAEKTASILLNMLETNAKNISDFSILSNIADTFVATGNFNQAQKLFDRRLELEKQAFGPNNHKIAYILWDIGILHEKQNNFSKAEEIYLLAFAIITNDTEPIEYPSALLADRIAKLYQKIGKQDESIHYSKLASEIRNNYEKANPD